MKVIRTTCGCLAVGFLLLAGCGGQNPENALADVNSNNIQRLANLYLKFQSSNGWRGPNDEAEFRDFIENSLSEKLKSRIGVTDTDTLFINERDGQPFRIRYQITGSARGCDEPAIFEEDGKRGKRIVAFLNMVQREVDEQEYQDLWDGKLAPPQS